MYFTSVVLVGLIFRSLVNLDYNHQQIVESFWNKAKFLWKKPSAPHNQSWIRLARLCPKVLFNFNIGRGVEG